jgi:poly(beta-D-mannuronate) lyase
MMKNFLPGIVMLLVSSTCFCKTYLVHTQTEFESAAQQIKPGDLITIANGTYTPWVVTLPTSGTEKQPITVTAQTAGKVIFTGNVTQTLFNLTGNFIVLKEIKFANCSLIKASGKNGLLIDLKDTKHSRVTNCQFESNIAKAQFMPLLTVSGRGEYNQIDHCSFTGNIDNQDIQVKITKEACPAFTLINHNTFRDKPKVSWKNYNGGECVQIGQDPVLLGTAMASATVRDNTFISCNGEGEVISNKSSGNRYIKNYFENCEGELVMRGGHDCLIDSNNIKGGSGGIRANGTGHIITNNIISSVKTGIRLMYGMAKGKNDTGFYIAAENCVIKNNSISKAETGVLVGDNKNQNWSGKFDTVKYPSRVMQDIAPADNTIKDNIFTNNTTNILYQ